MVIWAADPNDTNLPPLRGHLYVADNLNYRVQKFLASRPPAPPAAVKPDNIHDEDWANMSQILSAVRNPINTIMPTMRWRFVDLDEGDRQSAFQLQLAYSNEFEPQSMLYDSGVIEEESVENIGTHQIPEGVIENDPLISDVTYYYQVRVRDGFGLWSQYSKGSFAIDTVAPMNPYIKNSGSATDKRSHSSFKLEM
jgi:hypothetical protein